MVRLFTNQPDCKTHPRALPSPYLRRATQRMKDRYIRRVFALCIPMVNNVSMLMMFRWFPRGSLEAKTCSSFQTGLRLVGARGLHPVTSPAEAGTGFFIERNFECGFKGYCGRCQGWTFPNVMPRLIDLEEDFRNTKIFAVELMVGGRILLSWRSPSRMYVSIAIIFDAVLF